jgi:hypothetical protein
VDPFKWVVSWADVIPPSMLSPIFVKVRPTSSSSCCCADSDTIPGSAIAVTVAAATACTTADSMPLLYRTPQGLHVYFEALEPLPPSPAPSHCV